MSIGWDENLNLRPTKLRRYGTDSNFELYKADYVTLYVDNIRAQIYSDYQRHEILMSSPSNGPKSEADGYIADWPGDPNYGDGKWSAPVCPIITVSSHG